MTVDFDVREQQGMDFTGGSVIILVFWVINTLTTDLFLTNMQLFSSQDINWWTGVVWITCVLLWCFYHLFGLSFWRHPFTAGVTIHCWASDGMLHFTKSVPMKKQTRLHLRSSEGESIFQIFIFGWTIPFKVHCYLNAPSPASLWATTTPSSFSAVVSR